MNERQKEFFSWTLIDEGEYSNDPQDAGGPTRWGITLEDLQTWRGHATEGDVKKLSQDEAQKIYIGLYWNPLRLDEMPEALAYVVFDAGLLHGIYRAAKWLQTALGVTVDGKVGPKTLAAAQGADQARIINDISGYRVARAKSHPKYKRFGRGWINRITRVKMRALKILTSPLPSKT